MSETQKRPRQKKILWAAIVLLVIAAAAAWWAWKCGGACRVAPGDASSLQNQEEQFVIAVAPFWGSDEKAVEEGRAIQRLAEETLREELGAEEGVAILAEEADEPPRTDEEARNFGGALHADIIVWGHVFVFQEGMEIRPYFTALTPLRWLREEERSMEVLFAPPEQGGVKKTEVDELRNVALLVAAAYYQNEPDKALRLLQKIDPPTVESLRWQANVYYILKKWKESEGLTEEALALALRERYGHLRPEDAVLLSDLGWVYFEQARYEEARAEFRKTVELDPEHVEAHSGLGWLFYFDGNYDEALAEFRKAIALDPNNAEARNGLGWVYYHEGKYEEAIGEFQTPITDSAGAEYRKAIEIDYDDVYVQLACSLALLKTGRGEEAQAHMKEAARMYKGIAEAEWPAPLVRFYLGEITEEEVLEAAKVDDETLEQEQRCEAYYYMGMAYALGVGPSGGAPQPKRQEKVRGYLEKSLATGAADLPEYRSAERELKQLQGRD
jgi:tetratricopeptide (TPR) repeat protein